MNMLYYRTAVGIRCADHVTASTRKSLHYFADSGGRSVGIVRLRTKATEFSLVVERYDYKYLYYASIDIPLHMSAVKGKVIRLYKLTFLHKKKKFCTYI
jgi:hypothetical protein